MKKENHFFTLPLVMLICFIVWTIVAMVLSASVISTPVLIVPAGIFVVLEVLLAVCLHRIPVWIHGLIVIGQIAAGMAFSYLPFMILMVIEYIAAILVLYFWARKDQA